MTRKNRNSHVIPTLIEASVSRADMSCAQVDREFRSLVDNGAKVQVAGAAKRNPKRLLALGYSPKHKIELFDTCFYLTNVRQNPELRFFVGYVVQPTHRRSPTAQNAETAILDPTEAPDRFSVFPRILYKDLSLVWRSASHYSDCNGAGLWVGKGDTYTTYDRASGDEIEESRESTTDLPIEMQSALESLLPYVRRVRSDEKILGLVLREAPESRIRPFADFSRPRIEAASVAANRIHGGRSIARFKRRGDPTSLEITPGFEPDFGRGILEESHSKSRLYGGKLRRFRILSKNKKIQYGFIAGPKHVWIMPPQATTTELSSYGVRTIDVIADDDLFVPGYEYHYYEDGELYSQIPEGFAGEPCAHDDAKADASPWLDAIPVIREFRRKVLGQTRA